jgi:hypothetical protein
MPSTNVATSPDTLTYTTPIHTLATSADARSPLGSVATIMPDRRNCTGYHCATNGRTLAVVPFQLHSVVYELNHAAADPSIRLVPGKVIKGVKAIKGTRTLDTFPNGSSTGSDGTAHDGCAHSFPPVSDVLKNQRTTVDRVVVNLNAKLLYELALALGSEGTVSLHCDPQGRKATIVMPINGSVHDAIGVIMPLSTGKDSASSPYGELEHIAARFATVGR